MDEGPAPAAELDALRQTRASLEAELARLREELAEARREAERRDEAHVAERHGQAGRLAASEARSSAAEVDARAAWRRAAELGASLGRRIAEGQARLIGAQAAVASLESANLGLAAGRAAIALREADLRAVIESAIDCAIVTTDRDGLVLAWNSGARRLLGWDEAQAVAMDMAAVLPADAGAALAADIAAALAGHRVTREGWLRRQDGTSVWAGIEAMALRAGAGEEPAGVLWMLRDRGKARRAEAALRAREERLRNVLDGMAEGFGLLAPDFTILEHNLEALRMDGRRREEIVGRSHWDAYPGTRGSELGRLLEHAMAARVPVSLEHRYAFVNGQARWLEMRAYPTPDGALAVFWRDVTDRKAAEAALCESEERFRGFAENSADVLWILDARSGRLDYVSPAFERVFGEARGAIMAEPGRWRELVHPEDREAAAAAMPRSLAGETVVAHYRVVRPDDGRVLHLRDTGFPIRDATGAVARVAGIVQDITDIREAEARLRESEARYRTLFESIDSGFCINEVRLDAPDGRIDCRVVEANPAFHRHTGFAADILGRWLREAAPALEEHWYETYGRVARTGRPERFEQGSDMLGRWFDVYAFPTGTPEQRRVAVLFNDVSARRSAEALLRELNETLEQQVADRTAELMAMEATLRQAQKLEAIGQLTGGIAHDFNNMLQGVAGGLDMARRRMEAGRAEEAARYLDAARDATARAAGLTRRLLAFARRQRLEPRPVDPDALVRGMAEMLRRTMGPTVALELVLEDGCGFVSCDANELESVLLNLCINARDAMPDGGRLVVSTRDRALTAADLAGPFDAAPGAFVEIAVADTGTGMPPEVLERALEPFFTTKPLGRGTGLGLSQVYGFVRQSGGALRIESALGAGTTVRIWLPLLPRQEQAEAAPAEDAPPAEGRATLLLVDDETGVREPAAARLRDLGYTVAEAPDGPAALRLLEEGLRPDLLVTDVGLPAGMDGTRVAEAAQRRLPGLPVLFMTGYATAPLPLDAEVIGKPFALDALTARVRAALAGAAARRG